MSDLDRSKNVLSEPIATKPTHKATVKPQTKAKDITTIPAVSKKVPSRTMKKDYFTPDQLEQGYQMIREGMTYKELAEKLKCSRSCARKYFLSARGPVYDTTKHVSDSALSPKNNGGNSTRPCLKCDKPFPSKGLRICPTCTKSNALIDEEAGINA